MRHEACQGAFCQVTVTEEAETEEIVPVQDCQKHGRIGKAVGKCLVRRGRAWHLHFGVQYVMALYSLFFICVLFFLLHFPPKHFAVQRGDVRDRDRERNGDRDRRDRRSRSDRWWPQRQSRDPS